MQTDIFEKALDEFLQGKNYDHAEEAIYQLARAAFLAGWYAAKSCPSNEQEN